MPATLWLDLGRFGEMNHFGSPLEQWQDHGLGLLRWYGKRTGRRSPSDSNLAVTQCSGGEKAHGVDYDFYAGLRAGKQDDRVDAAHRKMTGRIRQLRQQAAPRSEPGHLYLLTRTDNSHALSYGKDAMDAMANWRRRQSSPGSGEFDSARCKRIRQQDMHRYTSRLR
jgi:hypothetical protein